MNNRLVIVGAGRIGSDLLGRLAEKFEVTVVDLKENVLDPFQDRSWARNIHLIQGDATSRLVLEEARVHDADIVLLTCAREEINLETARVLRENFSISRIISVGITTEGIEELKRLEVEVANIFLASSHSILNLIGSGTRVPREIGTGKGEILELTVHPRSRLLYKPLERLVPINWRVGLIYRNGGMLVPDGKTRLMPQDRVILIGDPSVVKTVAELLTFSTHDFPLEYGTLALIFIQGVENESYFSEVEYLLNALPFREVVFMLSPAVRDPERFHPFFARIPYLHTIHSTTEKDPWKAILGSAGILHYNCGLIIGDREVLLGAPKRLPYRIRRIRSIEKTLAQFYAPILFSSGTFPYERIVMPALPAYPVKPLLETALEVSGQLHAELSLLFSPPSRYTSGEEERAEFNRVKKTVSGMALLYKRKVQTITLDGNPVIEVTRVAREQNLLVLESGGKAGKGVLHAVLNPDPVVHLLARSPVSILLQPPESIRKPGLSTRGKKE